MTPDDLTHLPNGCDLYQQQISELADSGEPLTPSLRAHLAGCAACAQFAERWLSGPPAILAQPVSAVPDASLRARILHGVAPAKVVRFPTLAANRPSPAVWFSRIAACLALAGFSYWLLSPSVSPVPSHATNTPAPTLTQDLLQMEDGTKHEQQALRAALVDSGRQVRGDVAWSLSALEL